MNDFLRLLDSEARKILQRERGVLLTDDYGSDVEYTRDIKLIKEGAAWGYDQGWTEASAEIKRLEQELRRIDWRKPK